MSRKVRILVVFIGLFFAIALVIVTTHILDYYRISSVCNSPGLEQGQVVFSTNLLTPKRFDYIAFKHRSEYWCQQMVGVAGDRIEFIGGYLHVNGKNVDDSLPVKFRLLVEEGPYYQLLDAELINGEESMTMPGGQHYIFADPDTLTKLGIRYITTTSLKNTGDPLMEGVWPGKKWNADHFGPVTIPEGKVFMAGNNRQNSLDSRYIGFVDEKDITGVIFW